jgi:ribonuclease HI
MAKKKKYYVVWAGNTPGVYETWNECLLQTKGYPNAKYKSFKTLEEATIAFNGSYVDHFEKKASKSPASLSPEARKAIVWDSISVDAACAGNPGVMEYQGVDTKNKAQIFHQKFELGTNNIGEFLAIVHALAMFKKTGNTTPIYTDSRTAMAWVRNKKVKTVLKKTAKTKIIYELIARAEAWLKANTYSNKILKWETKEWGEIPADFGRK